MLAFYAIPGALGGAIGSWAKHRRAVRNRRAPGPESTTGDPYRVFGDYNRRMSFIVVMNPILNTFEELLDSSRHSAQIGNCQKGQ